MGDGVCETGEPNPIGAACVMDGCDATIIPEPPVYDSGELRECILAAGWGWDAWAGRNLPMCPQHAPDHTKKEVEPDA